MQAPLHAAHALRVLYQSFSRIRICLCCLTYGLPCTVAPSVLQDAVPASPDSKRGSSFLYALEYRATQKKIARQYLGMTRRALQEVMSLLAED